MSESKKSLTELATSYGTDKYIHKFTDFYEKNLPSNVTKLLEIGIWKGESLKMWGDFYPNATIYGIDVEDKKQYEFSEKCKIFKADQSNLEDIKPSLNLEIPFDVIIEDGGHLMVQQQKSLLSLLKHTKYYIIEDLHTSILPLAPIYGDGSTLPFLLGIKPKSDFMSTSENKEILEFIESITVLRNIHSINNSSLTSIIKTKL